MGFERNQNVLGRIQVGMGKGQRNSRQPNPLGAEVQEGAWCSGAKEKTSLRRRTDNTEGRIHNLLGDLLEFEVKVNIMGGRCPQEAGMRSVNSQALNVSPFVAAY